VSLLGLDIGTTGCKAVAFNIEGKEIAKAYKEYPLLHPFVGSAELDPDRIWESVREIIRKVNMEILHDPVKALAVSSQGETCVPIDGKGRALYNFVVTFDNRTIEQEEWWEEHTGAKKIFSITGMPLHPMYSLNKLMWFKKHRPDVYNKAWKFLLCEDYIIYRLTGLPAIDHSLAARTMAFDITARRWSEEIIGLADIEPDRFADVHPSGTAVETVDKKIASDLGFSEKVIVATGGHDQPCGALGAGIIASGNAMNATGTSDVLCPAVERPVLSGSMLRSNFSCYPHVFKDFYCSIGFNLTGGLLLRWYRDTFCKEEIDRALEEGRDVYEVIFENMGKDIRDIYFLPHFVGSGTPALDSRSCGAILGLTLDVRKPEIARAAIDSINYEMKLNIECMEKAGISIDKLHAIGGGAKSKKWMQMKADVFEKPVCLPAISESAAFGAALLAGLAQGSFSSLEDAVRNLVKIKEIFEPDKKKSELYREKYEKYKDIYSVLKKFNYRMHEKQQ
jgi:xylulokinase